MNDDGDGGGGGGDGGRPGGATTDTSAGGLGAAPNDARAPTVDHGGSGGAVHHRHARHHNRRYRGVYHEPDKDLWRARLYWRGKHTTLGRYSTPEAAARAHDRAAVYVFGPLVAITNFREQTVDQLPRDELPFQGKVAARLVELRELVQQAPHAPYVQVERDARARRRVAASAALRCWVEENNHCGRRYHHNHSAPSSPSSSTALRRRLLESSKWHVLVLAAVLVPPPLPAVSLTRIGGDA